MEDFNYYVYKVIVDNRLVYVGKGKGSRLNHVTSGSSHNSKLNEYYFRYKLLNETEPLVHIVKEFIYEGSALRYEKFLIRKYLPECNSTYITPVSNIRHTKNKDKSGKVSVVSGKDTSWSFDNLLENYLFYKESTLKPPLTMTTWLKNKLNNSRNPCYVKFLQETLTTHAEEIHAQRITEGGAPRSFKSILSMTEGEYCAFKRYCKKLNKPLKSLSVDDNADCLFVKNFLYNRRNKIKN